MILSLKLNSWIDPSKHPQAIFLPSLLKAHADTPILWPFLLRHLPTMKVFVGSFTFQTRTLKQERRSGERLPAMFAAKEQAGKGFGIRGGTSCR